MREEKEIWGFMLLLIQMCNRTYFDNKHTIHERKKEKEVTSTTTMTDDPTDDFQILLKKADNLEEEHFPSAL